MAITTRTHFPSAIADEGLPHIDVSLLCCRAIRLESWARGNLAAPYWRLYYNPTPGAAVRTAGRRIDLTEDAALLIPPETPYEAIIDHPVTHVYLHFLTIPGFVGRDGEVYVLDATPEIRSALDELAAIIAEGDKYSLHAGTLSLFLIHAALRLVSDERFERSYDDARISQAVDTLNEAIHSGATNDALARDAHMNTNAFIRLFKKTTGMTPQAFLAALRVERACILLHSSSRTIDDIAEATGFCDRYHLSHAFKKLRGMGPATFRRLLGG